MKRTHTQSSAGSTPRGTEKEKKRNGGTRRWPSICQSPGEFILLPKVMLKRFHRFGIGPHHLLLILMLQSDRFQNRPPRHYWEELALWCGRSKNTVRNWGYELEEKGLLKIRRRRTLSEGQSRRPGVRNERNEFILDPLLERVKHEQLKWQSERPERRAKRVEADK